MWDTHLITSYSLHSERKNIKKKDIAEFFENYKQRIAEKPTIETQLKNLTIQVKEPRNKISFKFIQQIKSKVSLL